MQKVDRLDGLLRRFSVRARQFHIGDVVGGQAYAPQDGQGFIHILEAGEVVLEGLRGAESIVVQAPSVVIIPLSVRHEFRVPSGSARLACATIDFEGVDSHLLVPAFPDILTVETNDVPGLPEVIDLLRNEASEGMCGHRHVVDRLFDIVLIKVIRYLFDTPSFAPSGLFAGLADAHIARALTAIHEEPGYAWNLSSLADEAFLSRSSFAMKFKELVGTTPHAYLTRWRMLVAKQMLQDGRPVAEVASTLGYSGTSFSRRFSQTTGLSPRQWVRSAG